jgi:hypothetical protein
MRRAIVRGRNCYLCACENRAIPCVDLDVTVLGLLYDRRRAKGMGTGPVALCDEPQLVAESVTRVRIDAAPFSPRITWTEPAEERP